MRDLLRRHFRVPLTEAGESAKDALAHAAAGDKARDAAQWADAASHYAAALESKPDWIAIRVQFAHMLKETKRYEQAEAEYRRAISAVPDDADVHLNLGHLFKLQQRPAEARRAYLDAAARAPSDLRPREELRSLGVGLLAIEQHIAACRLEQGDKLRAEPGRSETVLRTGMQEDPALNGMINEVGRRYVAGELTRVGADDLPLTLVCRTNNDVVGTCYLELQSDEAPNGIALAQLPGTIPFRIDFEFESVKPLHLLIEPGNTELVGSPFVLPGSTSGDLIARMERIENLVDSPGITRDAYGTLEQRLARSVTAMAADQIEQMLQAQRVSFERQLLALELITGQSVALANNVLESGGRLSARDPFPGIGWSAPRQDHVGGTIRQLLGRGYLHFRATAKAGFLLGLRISRQSAPECVQALLLSVDGIRVPHWLEGDRESSWVLTALLPARPIGRDVTCIIEDRRGFTADQGHNGVAVSEVTLLPVNRLDEPSVTLDEVALHGAEAILPLPAINEPTDALIALDENMPITIRLALNDTVLERCDEGFIAPRGLWRRDTANLLSVANGVGARPIRLRQIVVQPR